MANSLTIGGALVTIGGATIDPLPQYAGAGTATATAVASGMGSTSAVPTMRGTATATATATGAGAYISTRGAGAATAHATASGVGATATTGGAGTATAHATASGVGNSVASRTSGVALHDSMLVAGYPGAVLGRAAALLEAVAITSAPTARLGYVLVDAVRITAIQSVTERAHLLLSSGVVLRGAFMRSVLAALADTARLTVSAQAHTVVQLLDTLKLTSALAARATRLVTMADAVQFQAELVRLLGGHLADSFAVHDVSLAQLLAVAGITEHATFSGVASPKWVFSAVVPDHIHLSDDPLAQMIFRPEIFDQLEMCAGLIEPNGSLSVWTMNTRTAAVTEYQNYPFNSFARLGPQQYIAGADDGLYELLGDDDAGDPIIAQIRSGFLQFGQTHLSRLKAAYIAARGGGCYLLKIVTSYGEEWLYEANTSNMQSSKVNMGKGQNARYFAFELISSGQDFDLDTIEFVPIVKQRRV